MQPSPYQLQKSNNCGHHNPDTQNFDDYQCFQSLNQFRIAKIRAWHEDFIYALEVIYETPQGIFTTGQRMGPIRKLGRNYDFLEKPLWMLKFDEIFLGRNEYVIKMHGHAGNIIDHLILTTNLGKTYKLGSSNGGQPFQVQIPDGNRVVGFFGGYGGHIHEIGAYYKPIEAPFSYQYGFPIQNRFLQALQAGHHNPDTQYIDNAFQLMANAQGQHRIAKVIVYHKDFLYGIDVVYEIKGKWSKLEIHGKEYKRGDVHKKHLDLDADEFITKVYGRHGNIIDKFCIQTNKGNKLEVGGNGGNPFEVPIPNGMCVSAFGFGFGGHIHNIKVHVGPIPAIGRIEHNTPYYVQYSPLGFQSHVYGGTHPDTHHESDFNKFQQTYNHRIAKIHVWHGKFIYGLQFIYEINGKKVKGYKHIGGHYHKEKHLVTHSKIDLHKGVYVIGIFGRNGDIIDKLGFRLSNGEKYEFGGNGGNPFDCQIPPNSCVGTVAVGQNGHIHNIKAFYGPIQHFAQTQPTFYFQTAANRFGTETIVAGKQNPDTKPFGDNINCNADNHRIAQVTVWHDDMVYGLQFIYENNHQYVCGQPWIGSGFQMNQNIKVSHLFLDVDEHIVKVTGRAGNIIDHIKFETNKGKAIDCGGHGGNPFDLGIPQGFCAGYFFGGKNGHIHNIKAKVGPIPFCYTSNNY